MVDSINILDAVSARPTFRERPVPLPGDLRPDWRITVLVLILRKCCKDGQSTLRRLHVLNWAIRSKVGREAFLRRIDGESRPDDPLIRFEPALARAIDFARGFGLVERVSGDRIRLLLAGARLADDLDEVNDCLVQEKMFLNRIGRSVTEAVIKALLKPGS